jgi:hypothetical protein
MHDLAIQDSPHVLNLGGVKYPYPICHKSVAKFTVKEDTIFKGTPYCKLVYKFEAECCGGYEMYRIDKDCIDPASTVEAGKAFV